MPVKTKNYGTLSRRADRKVLILDEPEVGGPLPAVLLKKLDQLGDDAYGYKAIESLSMELGVWLDPSQSYQHIRTLAQKKLLRDPIYRPAPSGGPPMKIYKLSDAGHEALKDAAAHYRALA